MTKTQWSDLPQEVQDAARQELGGVSGIEMISEGLNSDITLTAETGSGRVFIKGARLDAEGKILQLRREISINPYVTHLSPEIRLQVEVDGWLVVGFDYVEGRRADYSPNSPDIPLVLETLDALSETPCPDIKLLYSDRRHSNHARVEDLRRFAGNSLMHTDLNPGNVRISDGRAYLLDWARPTRGAAWSDAASLVMCLMTCGHTPRDAEAIVSALPVWKTLEPGDLDAAAHYQSALRSDNMRKPIYDPWSNASVEAARRWSDYRRGL
jgi:hypothetical protein